MNKKYESFVNNFENGNKSDCKDKLNHFTKLDLIKLIDYWAVYNPVENILEDLAILLK